MPAVPSRKPHSVRARRSDGPVRELQSTAPPARAARGDRVSRCLFRAHKRIIIAGARRFLGAVVRPVQDGCAGSSEIGRDVRGRIGRGKSGHRSATRHRREHGCQLDPDLRGFLRRQRSSPLGWGDVRRAITFVCIGRSIGCLPRSALDAGAQIGIAFGNSP